MYSIGEMSKLTGITAFTLRYYEKIGVLPGPSRQNGIRRYDEQDLQFIRFIHGLKETGMGLEDIAAIAEDGCLLNLSENNADKEIYPCYARETSTDSRAAYQQAGPAYEAVRVGQSGRTKEDGFLF